MELITILISIGLILVMNRAGERNRDETYSVVGLIIAAFIDGKTVVDGSINVWQGYTLPSGDFYDLLVLIAVVAVVSFLQVRHFHGYQE